MINGKEYKFVKISDAAKSYWSSNPDGEDVEKGGLGEILKKRNAERNIYTYLGGNANLYESSNAFALSNDTITPTVLGLASDDTSGRDNIIKFIHGFDAYDDNMNGNTAEKREWILGSFIHSRPVVIHYGTTPGTQSIVFAGANAGMLHAFDNATGEELWAFIPPTLLPNRRIARLEAMPRPRPVR